LNAVIFLDGEDSYAKKQLQDGKDAVKTKSPALSSQCFTPVNSIDILRVNTQISILSNEVLLKRAFILLSFYTLKSFRTATINVKNLQTLIDPNQPYEYEFRLL